MSNTKNRTMTLENYQGLEYITVTDIPCGFHKKYGETVHASVFEKIDKIIAVEILTRKEIPIRGKEVRFLRKVAGLSLAKLGAFLGLSDVSIKKWEDKAEERLCKTNEISFKLIMLEIFNVSKITRVSDIVGSNIHPEEIKLKAS